MPGVDVSNMPTSLNVSGNAVQQMSGQMPNIAQQQTWNNPSWTQQARSWLNSDSMSQGMGIGGGMSNMDMLTQADQLGGQLFGLLAGQNESTVGNVFKALPMGSTIGNLINAAFGSHINEEFVKQTELGINSQRSRIFNSNTNADVLNDWRGFNALTNVSKGEVGSDGWFSNKAKNKTRELNRNINAANDLALLNFGHAVENADANTDLRIAQGMIAAYGGPIGSFRKYYNNGGEINTPQFFAFEPQTFAKGGYLNQAKALIRQNEGFLEKPYHDAPKGKNWRSVGYGFNDSGFREKYPDGISKHYEHGITKKQAEEELDYFLGKAEKTLKGIYGKQWDAFTDNEKAAILDTYYQRPASVGKSSRFYKAVTAGEDAGRYLGVAGFNKRNKIRQETFGGSQDYIGLGESTGNTETNSSSLQEVTSIPVVQDLDLSGITPTQAKALELNLSTPSFDMNLFGKSSTPVQQQPVPTVGTVEDFLASYGDFENNLFDDGGWMGFLNSWNQAQGGGGYVGQGQNLFNGIQTNTSNGSVGDWMGIATGAVNTITNWGKKDESLGRSGYGQIGMMAYDLYQAIRGATKHYKEPMDQKLGIPIYAQGGHLFPDGGGMMTGMMGASGGSGEGMGAMGYAQMALSALKLASNAKYQASLDEDIDEDKINRSIDRQGYNFSNAVANVQTNGDLLDLWQNYSEIPANLTMRDFRDKSLMDDFMQGYAASWEGFNAGAQTGNPYVAAAGAIIGGISSNIGATIGRNKAKNAARDANKRIERANQRNLADLNYGAERVDAENDLRILQNMGANGGKLSMGFGLKDPFIIPDGTANPLYRAFGGGLTHGAVFDTGINFVNEGGSHGQNPLGGVPVGADEQGIPNLVEEDEAIWNGDYVFSRRMKVPKKLREKYKLPDDATFADAVKKLTKESEERPLDRIARNTQDHILGELADSQEEMRMAKAQRAMEKEQQLRDDFLTGVQFGLGGSISPQGLVPFADNVSPFELAASQFKDGGGIHIDPSKRGTFKAQASKMGMGVQEAASHILANKEDYSHAMVKKAVFAKNFAHAYGGSLFDNPFGETNTFDFGGDLKTRRDTIMKNSGVTEEQANAMLFRMLSKEDRGRAIKERVFGTWTPTYNSNMEIVVPTSTTSNREMRNGNQATASNPQNAKKGAGKTSANRGSVVPFAYDWYRNGSDGIGTPTGFKVGKNGKAYDYTPEYKALVDSLGADDIRAWAAEHPNDPSLKSFLAKGNKLEDLKDDQWRKGATDGKYGFMHHVAEQKLQESTRGLDMPEGNIRWTPDPTVIDTPNIPKQPTGTYVGNTQQGSSFQPKQTWTRNIPWMMSGIMGLKEMLTPADYGNADMILDAAYRAGQPVSVGTEYIGDYRRRNPFDERYLMNIINQNRAATNRNMMNISGGNRAIGMSGILANDLTTQMSLAEAARQAYLANRADEADVAAFNKDTNKFNAQAQNTRNLTLAQLNSQRQNAMLSGIGMGARLRQAIKDQRDAAISANLSNFAQGLGDLGKENGYYNMIGGLNEEGILKYFFGDDWKTRFNNTQNE